MLRWIRRICIVYGLCLTFFLLAPDPLSLLGIPRLPTPPGGRGVHLVLFTGLALLVYASRWPIGRVAMLGLLVAYALGTELLQRWVPTRTVDPVDAMENLAGLALAAGIWRCVGRRGKKREEG